MSTKKVVMVWSGGKDASMALHRLIESKEWEVVALMSTINGANHRLSMHGVPEELIEQQAAAIGLPLVKMYVHEANYAHYEEQLAEQMQSFFQEGVRYAAFGDIFLEDLRIYREQQLEKVGMKACFPLWGEDTKALAKSFIDKGFRSTLCCANEALVPAELVGKEINDDLLKALPKSVDPCGENGEFHTFCHQGPIFDKQISFKLGVKVYQEYEHDGEKSRYCFQEILAQ